MALAGLIRLIHLDADPHYYGWWGYVFDEGRWAEQARSVALTGALPAELGHNALIAPLFELGTTIVFLIGGASLAAGRVIPALSGIALTVLVWLWLRDKVSPSAALLGIALVALPADLVVLSRITAPEMPALLGTTVAFMVLAGAEPTRPRMVIAGLICAAVMGLKVTTFFVVGIFIVVALTLRTPGAGWRPRVRDACWFAVGVGVPGLLAGLIAWAAAGWLGIDVWSRLSVFTHFFGVRDAYSLASLPYMALDAPVIVPSGLAIWLGGLAWLGAADRRSVDLRWIRSAVTWAVLYIVVFTFQLYFPGRYRVHVLVPLALVAAHAVSRLEQNGIAGFVTRIRAAGGVNRVAIVAFVVFVAAVHVAALVNPAASLLGLDPARLSVQIGVTGLCWVLAGALLFRRVGRHNVVELLIAFSVVATVLQFASWVIRPFTVEFFLVAFSELPVRLALVSVEVGVAMAFVRGSRRAALRPMAALAAAALCIVAWGVHLWPGLATPRFTARDAGVEVGRILSGETGIRQNRAEGLFIGNTLAYTVLEVPSYELDPPRFVVVELPLMRDTGFLRRHYDVVQRFELFVPPGHALPPRRSDVCSGSGQCFAVMRLRDGADAP